MARLVQKIWRKHGTSANHNSQKTYLVPLNPVNYRKYFASLNCKCIFELRLVYTRQSHKPFVPVSRPDKVAVASMSVAVYVVWHIAMSSHREGIFYPS